RALREKREDERSLVLAATDPASPWGAALPWPTSAGQPQRAAGAQVILRGGELLAWAGRSERNLLTFLPESGPEREAAARELAHSLSDLVAWGRRRAVLVAKVDGRDPKDSPLARPLADAGFAAGSRGWLKRGPTGRRPPTPAFDSRTPPRLAR